MALCFVFGLPCAAAQEYPTKSIEIVVGFPPEGSNDVVARILAPKLAEILAVPVVIELSRSRQVSNTPWRAMHTARVIF